MLLIQQLGSQVIEKPSLAPKMMMDLPKEGGQMKLPEAARVTALLMTGSCLSEPNVLEKLYQAMKHGCTLIPVNCDETFRFPNPQFYKDMHPIAEKMLVSRNYCTPGSEASDEGGYLVDGIEDMFKNI